MQQWTDLFLNMPLPESWMRGLLFVTFGLHLLFVLLMLGTAVLSLLLFLRDILRQPSPAQHWNNTSRIRTWGSRAWLWCWASGRCCSCR